MVTRHNDEVHLDTSNTISSESTNVYTTEDADFAYLLGVYFGDGHIYYVPGSYQLTIVSSDRQLCEISSSICSRICGNSGTISPVRNYFKLVVCSQSLCDSILGRMSINKDYISANKYEKKSVLGSPDSHIKDFLIGLMDSDGWISRRRNGSYFKYEVGFKNTSHLSEEIYKLMLLHGLKCSKLDHRNQTRNGKECKKCWCWTINPKSYSDLMSFRLTRKQQLLEQYKIERSEKRLKKGNNIILRVSDQEKSALRLKSEICGLKLSKLIRSAAFDYWPETNLDSDALLSIYRNGDYKRKRDVVEVIFRYLRISGYPHRKLSSSDLSGAMLRLSRTKHPLLDDNHLQVNTTGLELANYFHPHMMSVRCRNGRLSPQECFDDDDSLRDAINRWLELGNKPSFSGLRRILRIRDGVRSVVNFKPAIAKYFYDTYCNKGAQVLDPCMGFGGRLSGLISSNKCLRYVGIDPWGDIVEGNSKMASFFSSLTSDSIEGKEQVWQFQFTAHLGACEDIMPDMEDQFDFIFTSPPFFNVEKYDAGSLSQSHKRYPRYSDWKLYFLTSLISESERILASDGRFALNVKNYSFAPIADDAVEIASKSGLILEKTYHMRLANSEYGRSEAGPKFHTEPVFLFRCR